MTRACCPEIYFQWHPFTLTSAPEKDYISVHVRQAEGWSNVNPPINKVLPCVMVDGLFGSVSEDFSNYGTVLLVGAGIGVTLLGSILKSISYQMTSFNNSKSTRLSKVYFTWVISDFGMAHRFYSLLRDRGGETKNRIQISIYLTAKQRNGAEKDAITSLRTPTHSGRLNWDRVSCP
ncbi:hypothetical protein JB92DRAFT_3312089 [Gautieria morchelliformis]|nr:hypothetical protein JB92DRAFT_3312089 [Gautieria morchelliformis]